VPCYKGFAAILQLLCVKSYYLKIFEVICRFQSILENYFSYIYIDKVPAEII